MDRRKLTVRQRLDLIEQKQDIMVSNIEAIKDAFIRLSELLEEEFAKVGKGSN